MAKYKANQTLNDIQLRINDLIKQKSFNQPLSLDEWNNTPSIYPIELFYDASNPDTSVSFIQISNVPENVCKIPQSALPELLCKCALFQRAYLLQPYL